MLLIPLLSAAMAVMAAPPTLQPHYTLIAGVCCKVERCAPVAGVGCEVGTGVEQCTHHVHLPSGIFTAEQCGAVEGCEA